MENGLLSPAHEISNSACTGQLLRKCPKRVLGKRVWQKRFFVLEPEKRTIAYYANSKTGTMPMGVIAVQAIRGVNNVEESKKNYTSRFTIDLTGDWLFELRAQSRAEKERWLLAVKDMLKENVEFRHILEKFKHSKYWKPSIYQKLADDIEKERKRTQKIYDADAKKATKDSHRRKTIAREVQSAVESYAGVSRVNSQRRSKFGGMVSEVGGSHSRQISGLPPKKRQQMKSLLSVIQSREAVPGLRDSMHSSQEAGRATGVASTISHDDTLQMMKKDRSSSSSNNNNNSSNDSNNGTLKGRSPLADVTQKASKGGGGGEEGGDARGKGDGGGGEGGGSNDNKLRHSRGRSRGALTTDDNNRSPRSRSHSRSRSSRGKSKGGGGNGDRIVAAPNQQQFEIKMSEVVGSQQQQQQHRPIVNIKAGPAETPFPTKSRTSSTNHRSDDNKLPPSSSSSSSSSGIMPNPVKGYNNSKIPLIGNEQPQQQQRQQHRHHYLRGHRAPNYDNMISSNNLHTRLQQPIILNSGINLDDQLLHTGGGSTIITTSTQPGNNTSSSRSNEAHPMQPRPNHHQQPRDHNHHRESSPISLVIDKATSIPTATNNGEANRHSHNHRYEACSDNANSSNNSQQPSRMNNHHRGRRSRVVSIDAFDKVLTRNRTHRRRSMSNVAMQQDDQRGSAAAPRIDKILFSESADSIRSFGRLSEQAHSNNNNDGKDNMQRLSRFRESKDWPRAKSSVANSISTYGQRSSSFMRPSVGSEAGNKEVQRHDIDQMFNDL